MRISWILYVGFYFFFPIRALCNTLTLDDYLEQVFEKNGLAEAYKKKSSATKAKALEAELMFAPTAFLSPSYSLEKKSSASPQGSEYYVTGIKFGVKKMTNFGLSSTLGLDYSHTETEGANPALVPVPKYFESKPYIELSQSLWRNGFGDESRIQVEAAQAQALASAASSEFKLLQLRLEGEGLYLKLAVSREMLKLQNSILKRAERLQAWTQQRTQLSLADQSDLLSAIAAVNTRKIEHMTAQNEERSAARAFNSARDIDLDRVEENLQAWEQKNILGAADFVLKGTQSELRADIKMLEAQAQAAQAQSLLAKEKYTPTLDLFANYALNGKDENASKAASQSFATKYPSMSVGLKLSAILGGKVKNETVKAYRLEAEAAQLEAEWKKKENRIQLEELRSKISDIQERYKLAIQLEKSQETKLNYEKRKQQRGRSTLMQVLMYEQDFANSQLMRVKTESELLKVAMELRSFEKGN